MSVRAPLAVLACLLATAPYATAQSQADEADFDLPGNVIDEVGSLGLDLGDADFVGNPSSGMFSGWPEDLVIVPVPGRSPQIGWNLTLAGGYFMELDGSEEEVSPSVIGGFGMYAENGSYAYGFGGNFHLLGDDLRVKAGAGYMNVRYRYWGRNSAANDLGISLDILQEAPAYFVSAQYRVFSQIYMGLGFLYSDVETRARLNLPFFDPVLDLAISGLQIPIEFDTRDHEQFPRSGWLINANTMLYRDSLGGDVDAETFKLAVNRYLPMRERDVLALRAYVRATSDGAPFFLLSTFGGSTDLRGYPGGRYRDRMMYAVQGEYRWLVSDRWILTGFAGVGEVADNFGDMFDNFLPAAGVGARFVLSEKHRVGLSFDVATGNDDTEYYFGVGEAF